jgi:hypothetical protein
LWLRHAMPLQCNVCKSSSFAKILFGGRRWLRLPKGEGGVRGNGAYEPNGGSDSHLVAAPPRCVFALIRSRQSEGPARPC